ncbi:VanZ family protein [Salinisphaera sp. SWV1]|uniref:VanZ family protein n=1 Tax=Salinisphaera sp. SWV1 TaxID=3454139 RepID=UPI003F84C0EA
MNPHRVRRLWWALGLVLCAIFVYGCLMPNPPSAPGIPFFDKFEHGSAFLVMGAWFGALYLRAPLRVLLALSVFAAATELMQWASGYRDGDPYDWMADTAGAVVALVLLRLLGIDWVAWVATRLGTAGRKRA